MPESAFRKQRMRHSCSVKQRRWLENETPVQYADASFPDRSAAHRLEGAVRIPECASLRATPCCSTTPSFRGQIRVEDLSPLSTFRPTPLRGSSALTTF